MKTSIDLKAYFKRIGYTGSPKNSIETLRELHALHTRAIPFENLHSFLGLPVHLDIDSLQQKLIYDGRGGYCFEQNLLFKHVLEALGFNVTGLAGRVLWNKPKNEITRRTHMLLLIYINNINYLADVGFGSMTLTGPLELEPGKTQHTPHEPFRCMKPEEGTYFMQAQINATWQTLYRFDLHREYLIDYELANWFLSNYPNSYFTTNLMVSRPDVGCRYTLQNNVFKVHHLSGKTQSETLGHPDEWRSKLEGIFQLNLSGLPGLDEKLSRMAEAAHI